MGLQVTNVEFYERFCTFFAVVQVQVQHLLFLLGCAFCVLLLATGSCGVVYSFVCKPVPCDDFLLGRALSSNLIQYPLIKEYGLNHNMKPFTI